MELFDIPLYDNDFLKLVFRLAINLAVVGVLVNFVYIRYSNNKDYLFPFFMLNILVFFICFTLKKFDLGLGMALGLFAIFGILRYRTATIPIKEMTYLFTFIGVAIINSLANKKMSYAELILTDVGVVVFAAILESVLFRKQELRETILYERIDLIHPERRAEMFADIQKRTGIVVSHMEFRKINFLNDTALIDVYYYRHEQKQPNGGGPEVTFLSRDN